MTYLEKAKRLYLQGSITLEMFESMVEQVLAQGVADMEMPLRPPPKYMSSRVNDLYLGADDDERALMMLDYMMVHA